MKSARIAVKCCGKGCVGEGFCHFLQQEGDGVFLCDDAGDDADKEEKGFPHGDAGAEDEAKEGVEVAFAAEGGHAKQGEYGIPQGQIHGSWWDIAKVLGAEAKAAADDAEKPAKKPAAKKAPAKKKADESAE